MVGTRLCDSESCVALCNLTETLNFFEVGYLFSRFWRGKGRRGEEQRERNQERETKREKGRSREMGETEATSLRRRQKNEILNLSI